MAIYLWVIRPRFRELHARGTPIALADIFTAAFPVSLALTAVLPDWRPGAFLLVLACVAWLGIGLNPRLVVRLSGGPAPAYLDAQHPRHANPALAAALLLVVALVGGIPPAVDYALTDQPCAGAEWLLLGGRLLPSADRDFRSDTPLHAGLINAPGTLVEDRSMGIDGAAASRVYPNAREVLEFNGFLAAHRRVTEVSEKVTIQTDVFEFGDAEGAHGWQAAINRAACQSSNETFPAPGVGVGLQIRRRDPDFPRIVEQVSWVVGNRRFVISHSFWERPPDHETILMLARQGVTVSGGDR
jgi:hypothetical protein